MYVDGWNVLGVDEWNILLKVLGVDEWNVLLYVDGVDGWNVLWMDFVYVDG